MRTRRGEAGRNLAGYDTQPIVSNPDPGGYIAQSFRRKRQKIDQIRLRCLIVLVCFWMSFLMK